MAINCRLNKNITLNEIIKMSDKNMYENKIFRS